MAWANLPLSYTTSSDYMVQRKMYGTFLELNWETEVGRLGVQWVIYRRRRYQKNPTAAVVA